jgi:hypothetical protein
MEKLKDGLLSCVFLSKVTYFPRFVSSMTYTRPQDDAGRDREGEQERGRQR